MRNIKLADFLKESTEDEKRAADNQMMREIFNLAAKQVGESETRLVPYLVFTINLARKESKYPPYILAKYLLYCIKNYKH